MEKEKIYVSESNNSKYTKNSRKMTKSNVNDIEMQKTKLIK